MPTGESQFLLLSDKFSSLYKDVVPGKMMSSPGLKCNDKVFAFYFDQGMCFRLGPKFDPEAYGIKDPKVLSPFKTKPPLKGWIIVSEAEQSHWEALSLKALEFTRSL